MKPIARIEVFVIRIPYHYKVAGHTESPGRLPGTDYYVEPQWVHAYSNAIESCLIKISTEDGMCGWGEVQAPLSPQTPAALITTLLGPALLGQNPLATSVVYDRLYHLMLARGHTGGFLFDAIAGLDCALWDLKGRHHQAPIFELLGGPFQLEMPAYVSGLRTTGLQAKLEAARQLMNEGFVGVKLFTGAAILEAETEVREIHNAVGANAFLAVDAICKYDLSNAIQLGRALDDVRANWFEAPLNAEDIDGHAALARRVSTPIAIGETLRTSRAFEQWLRQRALAIAQPDIMRTGITGVMRIAASADAVHVPTTLHTGVCTGIGMAASWQVAAALPGGLPQEHQQNLFDAVGIVLKTPLTTRNGKLIVSQEPGIGVEVNEEAVAAHSIEHWVVDNTGRRLVAENSN